MKNAYPVLLTPERVGYSVDIPDFDIGTQGDTLAEALEMARDAIGAMGIFLEDEKKKIPSPTMMSDVLVSDTQLLSLVDVDFAEYRRKNDLRTVKKNCTIPSWLCYEAEKANINFSQVLQAALKNALHLSE